MVTIGHVQADMFQTIAVATGNEQRPTVVTCQTIWRNEQLECRWRPKMVTTWQALYRNKLIQICRHRRYRKCAQSLYALKLLCNQGMCDGTLTRSSFSQSYCMLCQPGGDSPVRPINNLLKHQHCVLYGPACTRPTILRFLNWLQIWTTTYLQRYGTILIMFCTNFYLIKLTTLTISDRVVIPFH